MGGAYGGAGAAGFADGVIKGYGSVSNAMDATQDRENRAKQAEQRAELHKAKMVQQGNINTVSGIEAEAYQSMQNDLKTMQADLSRRDGADISAMYGSIAGSKNPGKALERAKAKNKGLLKKYGAEIFANARVPSDTTLDNKKMLETLEAAGLDTEDMDENQIEELVRAGRESGKYIILGDGTVMDTQSANIVTGGDASLSDEQKEVIEQKNNKLMETYDKLYDAAYDRNALAEAKETELLKQKIDAQKSRLAGVPYTEPKQEQDDSSNKKKLYDELISLDIDPEKARKLSYGETSKEKPKSQASKAESVYEKKVKAYTSIIDKIREGKSLTAQEEATNILLGGTSSVNSASNARLSSDIKVAGTVLVNSKVDGQFQLPDISTPEAKSMLKAEARFMGTPQNKGIKKRVQTYIHETTNDYKAIMELREDMFNSVEGGKSYDVFGKAWQSLLSMAPDELDSLIDSDNLGEKIGITGQQAIVVGKMTKFLFGTRAASADRKTIENAFNATISDSTMTMQAKTQALMNIVSSQYKREGDALTTAGSVYTVPSTMNKTLSMQDKLTKKIEGPKEDTVIREFNGKKYLFDIKTKKNLGEI